LNAPPDNRDAQGVTDMRIATILTAAMLALAISAHPAAAQSASGGGGGGTIGCDPGLPTANTSATQCRSFFKEDLYGPAANPYAAPWHGYASAPVVQDRPVVRKKRSPRKSGAARDTRY